MPVHRAGTKEFVLQAPPEPRTKFVEVDPGATQMLMNFMIGRYPTLSLTLTLTLTLTLALTLTLNLTLTLTLTLTYLRDRQRLHVQACRLPLRQVGRGRRGPAGRAG